MNAKKRIETLVEQLNTSVKALSDLCGYDRPQLFYDILKGKTQNISPTLCERLTTALPRLSKVWLITGQEPMWTAPNDEPSSPPARQSDNADDESGYMVPLVNIAAMAGPIKGYYECGENLDNCRKIRAPQKGLDLAVPISGDSMEPVFHDGSTVFIKRINEAAFIPWGHPLVMDTENGVFIKRVMPDDNDRAYIWAESYNPRYPRMHMPTNSIYSMYRIVSVSQTFTTM